MGKPLERRSRKYLSIFFVFVHQGWELDAVCIATSMASTAPSCTPPGRGRCGSSVCTCRAFFFFVIIVQVQNNPLTQFISLNRPVKNRPGPVAGIPHVGGGGLRPLGPDDNDAVSGYPISRSPISILLPLSINILLPSSPFSVNHACPHIFHFPKFPDFSTELINIISSNI